ncbi:MAG TPA: diacylglycerol kinase family protein [Trichormus sp.]
MSKRALVVYNPKAQSAADPQTWMPRLAHELCEKSDFSLTLHAHHPENGAAELHDMLDPCFDLIIAAGGDGTIRSVFSAVAKTNCQTTCALLPLGTGNILARNLQIVDDNFFADPLEHAFDIIAHGEAKTIDMGMVNDELFVVMAGVGPLADIFMSPDCLQKSKLKLFAYLACAVKTMAAPPFLFEIEADGKKFSVESSGVFVSNVEDLGVNRLPDWRSLSDGMLELYVLNPKVLGDYLDIGLKFAAGGDHGEYCMRTVKEVKVSLIDKATKMSPFNEAARSIVGDPSESCANADGSAIMLDGDHCGTIPMHCKVVPNALKVLAPKDVKSCA